MMVEEIVATIQVVKPRSNMFYHSPLSSGNLGFRNLSVFTIDFHFSPFYNLFTGICQCRVYKEGVTYMYVYKISELLESLKSAQKDGFEYVSIDIVSDKEDDFEDSISLSYVDSASSSETDMIDSVSLPEGYIANLKY